VKASISVLCSSGRNSDSFNGEVSYRTNFHLTRLCRQFDRSFPTYTYSFPILEKGLASTSFSLNPSPFATCERFIIEY
jgi:hypothetical protein